MKRKFTKNKGMLTGIVLALLLLFTCAAANAEQTGSCGTGATWHLGDDGVLTISGTGAVTGIPEEIKDQFTSLIVEEGITRIGEMYWCSNLVSVDLPETLKALEEGAFYGCFDLDNITIPAGVTTIGRRALTACGLQNLQVAEGNRNYECVDGVLFNEDLSVLIQYPLNKQGQTYVIPGSVTTLSDSCFNRCHQLTSLIIPPSVTVVESRAISDCFGLTSLTVPETVEVVNEYSFSHNPNVTELIIEPGITELPGYIFRDYDSLTSVVIPDTVTSIGDKAFEKCENLLSVTIPASVTSISQSAFDECAEGLILSVQQGSYAEHFAMYKGIAYRANVAQQMTDVYQLELSNVTCEYESANKQLLIKGTVLGPSEAVAIRIASWQNDEPTAEEAMESAQNMVSVWKNSQSSLPDKTKPFQMWKSRPVNEDDLGKTQYTILAGLDTNLNLVGYAVIKTDLPSAYEQPTVAPPVILEKPESVQIGERFAVTFTADPGCCTDIVLVDPDDNVIGFGKGSENSEEVLLGWLPHACSPGVYTCELYSYGQVDPFSDDYSFSDPVEFQLNVTEGNRPAAPAIRLDPEEPVKKDIVSFIADREYEGFTLELFRDGKLYLQTVENEAGDRYVCPYPMRVGEWIAKISVCDQGIWSDWREITFIIEGTEYVPVPFFEGRTGRTYTVSIDYPDLKETYPVNLEETQDNYFEYNFGFDMTDGEHDYQVSTMHFKHGSPESIPVTQMQSDLWSVSDSGGRSIGKARLTVRGTSLVWVFEMPEEADLTNLRITRAFVELPGEYFSGNTEVDLSSSEMINTLYLPENLERIESEAFLNTQAAAIVIPDSVSFIGDNAFPQGATLILGADSPWWNWAEENGYNPVTREQ